MITFEVFDAAAPQLREGKLVTRTIFEQALLLYNQKEFKEAKQLFTKCLQLNPTDKVANIYRQCCRECNQTTAIRITI
jgi:adenylate cyclase